MPERASNRASTNAVDETARDTGTGGPLDDGIVTAILATRDGRDSLQAS